MAQGSQTLTTYYAKRIIGDTAAADAGKALLQTGQNIATDTWILHRSNRSNSLYGIKYNYDESGGADKLELYGGNTETINSSVNVPTVWVKLNTGDTYIRGKVGIGQNPDTYKLYVDGTSYFSDVVNIVNHDISNNDLNPTGALIIGSISGKRIDIDDDEIIARASGGDASNLNLNVFTNSSNGHLSTITMGNSADESGYVNIQYSADCSSTSTGALKISGGLYVAKQIRTSDNLSIYTQFNRADTTNLNSNATRTLNFLSNDNKTFAQFGTYKYYSNDDNSNTNRAYISIYNSNSTDTMKHFSIYAPPHTATDTKAYISWSDSCINNDIYPYKNETYTLGSSTLRWYNGYFSNAIFIGGTNYTNTTSAAAGTTIAAGRIELSNTTPYIDFHYQNDTANYNIRLLNAASGRLRITAASAAADMAAYNGRIINPILQVDGGIYSDQSIESKTYFVSNVGTPGNDTGYYIYVNNVVYGRYYPQTKGTNSVEGWAKLELGNNKNSTTTDNSSGEIQLFNKNGGSTSITGSYGTLIGNTNRNYINTGYIKVTQISGAGTSGSWNSGRNRAIFAMESTTAYSTAISIKTTNGTWDIGHYNSTNYNNGLIFSYVSDTLYNGSSATPPQILFTSDGSIWAGALTGNDTDEHNIGARSGAGHIYLASAVSSTGSKGLYVKKATSNTSASILVINQDNNISDIATIVGSIYLNNNTASSSTTTGALRISGGVGIGGKLYIGDNINVDGHIYLTTTKNFYMQYTPEGGTLTDYAVLRNYNNGNVAINACSAGLYLGYTTTTFINFLNNKMSLASNGTLSITGALSVTGNITGSGNLTLGGDIIVKHNAGPAVAFHDGTQYRAFVGLGSANSNHGLYSYGYGSNTSSFTSDGKWLIVRNANGDVTVNGDCTGSASKIGQSDGKTWLYFNNNNEINFGGSYSSDSTICFGYRATDSRPKPTIYIFGSGNGTATVKANIFEGSLDWQNVSNKPTFASTNTASAVVQRDSDGDFAARIITATRLIATSSTNAVNGSVNGVALITGNSNSTHLEIDNNEILAKSNASTVGILYLNDQCQVTADGKVTNAVWNDFAEYRASEITEPGRVVVSDGSGKVILSTKRLEPCAHVISDTYGMAVGESDIAKTPLGIAGRVLVIPYQARNHYKVGDCVCTAPNGTADIMTREEIIKYPDRIIGIVDEIPDYEFWNQNYTNVKNTTSTTVKINGRIWIYVR